MIKTTFNLVLTLCLLFSLGNTANSQSPKIPINSNMFVGSFGQELANETNLPASNSSGMPINCSSNSCPDDGWFYNNGATATLQLPTAYNIDEFWFMDGQGNYQNSGDRYTVSYANGNNNYTLLFVSDLNLHDEWAQGSSTPIVADRFRFTKQGWSFSVYEIALYGSVFNAGCNNNGVQDNGEGGVDCDGGGCPDCPPVCNNNGVQDNGEGGVDCDGGGCPDCPPSGCDEQDNFPCSSAPITVEVCDQNIKITIDGPGMDLVKLQRNYPWQQWVVCNKWSGSSTPCNSGIVFNQNVGPGTYKVQISQNGNCFIEDIVVSSSMIAEMEQVTQTTGKEKKQDIISDKFLLNTSVNIYPNPANNEIYFDMGSWVGSTANITMYNTLGSEIKRLDLNEVTSDLVEVNVNELQSGIYFIKIQIDQNTIISKKISINR